MKKIILLILFALGILGYIFINNFVTINNESPSTKTGKVTYKADKDMCGEIIFSETISKDFNSALSILKEEKKVLFSRACPNNPCSEIDLETKKAKEVRDLNGNLVDIDLYFIKVIDISTGTSLQSTSDAIDNRGNLYYLNWCSD